MPPSLGAGAAVGEVESLFYFLAVLIENGNSALPESSHSGRVPANSRNRAVEALSGFVEEVPTAVAGEDDRAAGENRIALIDGLLHVVVEHPLVISHFYYLFLDFD